MDILKNNKLAAAIIIVIAIAAIFIVPRFLDRGSKGISYVTEKADRSNVTSYIEASGTINPLTTIDVGTLVSGTINTISVDYNTEVKKGDPLAEIDPAPLKTAVKSAEANNNKVQADLNVAESLYKTNKELYDKRLISKEEFDDSKSRYSSALAAFEQAKVELEVASTNLENATIRSPIDGIVLSRNVTSGESVLANGKPLFTVSGHLQNMQVDTRVSESDIGKVEESQEALFSVDAYPGMTFLGKVEQVRNDPLTENNVVTYNVVVLTDNQKLKLKPGMTAQVKIVVADKENVLRVPTSAIRFVPPTSADIEGSPDYKENSSYVWIPTRGGIIKPLPIETGVSDDRYTEITSGNIKEGQEVIVEAFVNSGSNINSSYLPQPRRF
jgi:HlyD family secretion protein